MVSLVLDMVLMVVALESLVYKKPSCTLSFDRGRHGTDGARARYCLAPCLF